jgi:hypothetical protein
MDYELNDWFLGFYAFQLGLPILVRLSGPPRSLVVELLCIFEEI